MKYLRVCLDLEIAAEKCFKRKVSMFMVIPIVIKSICYSLSQFAITIYYIQTDAFSLMVNTQDNRNVLFLSRHFDTVINN